MIYDLRFTILAVVVGARQVRKTLEKRVSLSRTCLARCYNNTIVSAGEAIGADGNRQMQRFSQSPRPYLPLYQVTKIC